MKKYNLILIAISILLVTGLFTYFFYNNFSSKNLNANVISETPSILSSDNAVSGREVITSASEYDYPPFCIVDENGGADGFSVELLRAALNAVDLDVSYYTGPWSEIKQDLAEGRIQVLPLVGRTPEREALYYFSVPYNTMYGGIFIRRDTAGITKLSDLKDKAVLVMKGDNAEEFVNRIALSDKIVTTTTYEDAFKLLSEGHYDAIIAQSMVGSKLLNKLNITNVFLVANIPEFRQDWAFAVKKGDYELLFKLNEGLSKIIVDGTFDKLHEKWIGESSHGNIVVEIIPTDPQTRAELIITYDQQLTSSSENYITTSDEYWKNNYDNIGLKLDNLINQLTLEALEKNDVALLNLFKRLKDSNNRLVEMEISAHALVKEGKNRQADSIIKRPEYKKYKKIYSDTINEYLTYLGIDVKTTNDQINMMLLESYVSQYAEKINDRFDVSSKIPDPAEFMLMTIKNRIYENTDIFENRFSIIDGALRTNVSYYSENFGSDDVAGVMLFSNYNITDDKKKIMLALSRDLKTYTVSTNNLFMNRYTTFENGIDSIYPNEWIFERAHNASFKDEIWYYIVDPVHDPERESKWTPAYYDSVLGYWMVSLITPIYDGDEFIGTTGGDITLNDIRNQISEYDYYGEGYSFIFDEEKNILIHPEYASEIDKKGKMEELFSFKEIKEKGLSAALSNIANHDGQETFIDNGEEYTLIYRKLDSIGWYYGFLIKSDYLTKETSAQQTDNYLNNSSYSEIEDSILMQTENAKSSFYKLETDNIKKISILLEEFMDAEEYKTLFLENNRTKLYEQSLDLFNKNKDNYGITHFYYIYPNSTNFLRVHAPEQYGDSINRITFQQSRDSDSWGKGIELGKTSFALRVVHPYYYNDSLIGYVEFGQEIDGFIRKLKEQSKLDYGIIVQKQHIDESDWANVRKTQNLRNNYDDLSDYVIIGSTGSELVFNQLCFTEQRLDAVSVKGSILGQCTVGEKTYITSGFALFDVNNSNVGAVVLVFDITEFVANNSDNGLLSNLSVDNILYSLIILLVMIGAVLFILDKFKIIKLKRDMSLILLSLAVFIIIILFVFNAYLLTKTITKQSVESSSNQINSLANSKKLQIESYLGEQQEKIAIVATQSDLTDEELINIMNLQDDFYEIFVMDSNGIIIHSTDINNIGIDKSNDEYFINGKIRTYIKPAYLSESTNIETIVISTPFHSGVLAERLDITTLNKLTSDREGLGKSGEILLAYRGTNGDAVFFTDRLFYAENSGIVSKESTNISITQALLKNEELFLDSKDYRGVSVTAATRYIDEADTGLVVKIDTKENNENALKINNQIWYSTLAIIVLILTIGVVFNILLTRSLRKEIEEKTSELQNKTSELQANLTNLKNTKTAILNMLEDLNETNKHLKDLDEAKTNFLNVASHELKTPLTAISAYLDVLDDYKGEFTKEQLQGLDAIKRNSNQLKLLINNILEISRIESGRFEMNITEVNVRQKILMVVENLKILEHPNVTLKAEVPETLPKIMFDDMRFDEILNNLISNSIKFTEQGTITIKADVEQSGNFISLKVIDTGVGIPEDKVKNLFQNFYQVDSSISRKYGGTGLGLALTKKMIEHFGGTITVESILGKGTTFTVKLPIKQQIKKADGTINGNNEVK